MDPTSYNTQPHLEYYPGEDELTLEEVAERLIVKYGGDLDVLKAYFRELLNQELLEQFDEFIAIQCTDGTWNYDPYMQGMANGMIFMKSLVDGQEPDYLEAPKVWLADLPPDSTPPEVANGEIPTVDNWFDLVNAVARTSQVEVPYTRLWVSFPFEYYDQYGYEPELMLSKALLSRYSEDIVESSGAGTDGTTRDLTFRVDLTVPGLLSYVTTYIEEFLVAVYPGLSREEISIASTPQLVEAGFEDFVELALEGF